MLYVQVGLFKKSQLEGAGKIQDTSCRRVEEVMIDFRV